MNITDKNIDGGRPFDWGRTSAGYAKYRDIYPPGFYEKIIARGLCKAGQRVLDLGTGTGVLPRNMRKFGAEWVGVDISENQIAMAKELSKEMGIDYLVSPSEKIDFPDASFDVVTACQCFWYFNAGIMPGKLSRVLKDGGKLLILYMEWLPFEDQIAGESEKLILKYNPAWSGAGETVHPIKIDGRYLEKFSLTHHEEYRLKVGFTRESWNGRVIACRGIGTSLSDAGISSFEREHQRLLEEIAPEKFEILHYAAMAELTLKSTGGVI